MRTLIVIEVDHAKPIPHLADMIAGRAYTISGVKNADVVKDWDKRGSMSVDELRALGFSYEEISLGAGEVAR